VLLSHRLVTCNLLEIPACKEVRGTGRRNEWEEEKVVGFVKVVWWDCMGI
jgi:hypothetical protein